MPNRGALCVVGVDYRLLIVGRWCWMLVLMIVAADAGDADAIAGGVDACVVALVSMHVVVFRAWRTYASPSSGDILSDWRNILSMRTAMLVSSCSNYLLIYNVLNSP